MINIHNATTPFNKLANLNVKVYQAALREKIGFFTASE